MANLSRWACKQSAPGAWFCGLNVMAQESQCSEGMSKKTATTKATKTSTLEDFLPTPELQGFVRQAEYDTMMATTPADRGAAQARLDNLCAELGRRGEN